MAKIWITYNWSDNTYGDVDFVAQELLAAGLTVKLDRWNITAGKRLWQQIESFITSQDESDAWLLVATNNSLLSEACREEFAYALDRALNVRGQTFPIIALFLGPSDTNLIPAGIRTRLYVSISDPDWKERIVAAADGRTQQIQRQNIQPYHLRIHKNQNGEKSIAIEVRPRAGVWAPFLAAIPFSEKEIVDPSIMIGPRDLPTGSGMLINCGDSELGEYWTMTAGNQATPNESYYIWCKSLPSILLFGANGRSPQFEVHINDKSN